MATMRAIRAAFVFISLMVSVVAQAQPVTTKPNVSNVLTPCSANVPIVGNGSGVAPFCWATGALTSIAHVTSGTGVNAALAINVGSAGAFVVNGGAGGTPSSITLTNGSGLPIAGIASLGTGVGTALGVNIGSAGAPVLFNGALGSPSSVGTMPAFTLGGAITAGGFNITGVGALTATTINGNTFTTGTGTLTLGAVTLNAGAGGTLGSNAFTSTAYAPLASPTFTGVPAAPTATPGTNTTQVATTAYADAIAALKANIASPTFTGTVTIPTGASITTPVLTGLPTGSGVATANTVSTLVARDGSGNFSAGTITAALSGNATTATSATSATTATTATNATNTAITDDTTTNATMYPTWATANTGNLPQKVASTKLSFNPSTGALSSTSFTGAGTGLTGTAASLTAGTVTTNANLTGDVTSSGNVTTLASVASAGTTGSSTAIPVITINAKGLTTSITTAVVVAPAGTLSGATLASGVTASSLTSLGGGTVGTAAFKATGTSGNTVPLLDGTNTWTNLQTFNGGINVSGGVFAAGSIYKSASLGLTLSPISGSSNDFTILTPTGLAVILTVPTGTVDVQVAGRLFAGLTQTSAAQSGTVCFNSGTSLITYDATLGCLASSGHFKNITGVIRSSEALDIVDRLKPVSFTKKLEYGGNVDPSEQVGFVAEDVAAIDERLTARGEDGLVRGVRYQQMTAVLAGAIQALKAENDTMRACNANWKCRLFGIAN